MTLAGHDPIIATRFIDRAIEIDPNNAWAWMRRGWAFTFDAQPDSALDAFDHAELLSPLDPYRHNIVLGRAAALYHWTDRKAEAIALIEECLTLNPGVVWAYRMLATAQYYHGDLKAAQEAGRKLMQHHPHVTIDYLKNALPTLTPRAYSEGYYDALHAVGIPL